MLEVGDLRLDPATRRAWRGGRRSRSRRRSSRCSRRSCAGPGRCCRALQLLEHAWDYAYENRSNVVDVYVRYLREKIDRPVRRDSLETVRGAGYRLRGTARAEPAPAPLRLTLAFAVAMAVVLAGVGLLRLRAPRLATSTRAIDQDLRTRARTSSALVGSGGSLDSTRGRARAGGERSPRCSRPTAACSTRRPSARAAARRRRSCGRARRAADVRRAAAVPGSTSRCACSRRRSTGAAPVVVVGATAGDRAEALDSLRDAALVGGPLALAARLARGLPARGARRCGRSRRCAAAPRRSRRRRSTSACRSRRPTTRSRASARR